MMSEIPTTPFIRGRTCVFVHSGVKARQKQGKKMASVNKSKAEQEQSKRKTTTATQERGRAWQEQGKKGRSTTTARQQEHGSKGSTQEISITTSTETQRRFQQQGSTAVQKCADEKRHPVQHFRELVYLLGVHTHVRVIRRARRTTHQACKYMAQNENCKNFRRTLEESSAKRGVKTPRKNYGMRRELHTCV